MIKQLEGFSAIGWDFDGTLIGHKKSLLFQKFIKENPQKSHFIITFRSHGWQNEVFDELEDYAYDAPTRDYFVKIFNIEEEHFDKYAEHQRERLFKQRTGPLTPEEIYYITWKGWICHQNNIPVLIDDRTSETEPGCEKYGVTYLNPDDIW